MLRLLVDHFLTQDAIEEGLVIVGLGLEPLKEVGVGVEGDFDRVPLAGCSDRRVCGGSEEHGGADGGVGEGVDEDEGAGGAGLGIRVEEEGEAGGEGDFSDLVEGEGLGRGDGLAW